MPKAPSISINRTLNEKIDCEIRLKFFGGMKVTPKAVDTYTLDVTTAEPAPILPTMMGTMTVVSPNTVMDERTREPVGTGPYKFVSWTPGESVVLERFDGYWGEQPEVEKATYVWRTESSVRAGMVATGEADIAPNITELRCDRPGDGLQLLQLGDHGASASTSRARRSTTSGCARRSTSRSTARP